MDPSEGPQVPAPERSPAGTFKTVCDSTPSPGSGPHPPPRQCGLGGCWGRKHRDVPLAQHVCMSPHTPLHPSRSRQPLQRPARAHAGLTGHLPAVLAALASPVPTPCEPSWKAASAMAGGAGGWAWEAPRVSKMEPLPQALPAPAAQCGHRLSSHTSAMGLCTRKHILFLLLEHTQAYTPIFKQSHWTKESKHTQTHGACAHQFLDSALYANMQTYMLVS